MTTTYAADKAETQHIATDAATYAYRRQGPKGGIPLVLVYRLRATMDHWDPVLLDILASERDLIIFDNRGLGESTGTPATSIDGLIDGLVDFLDALGLDHVDLMGWSMGAWVSQGMALRHPNRVRRLIIAASAPGAPGTHPILPDMPAKAVEIVIRPQDTDEGFLYLFFPETEAGRKAGIASLRRLDTRLKKSRFPDSAQPEALAAQLQVVGSATGYWDRFKELTLPMLIANGGNDIMTNAVASWWMAQQAPSAKLIIYGDAGHGFLFQHADDFGREVLAFLH